MKFFSLLKKIVSGILPGFKPVEEAVQDPVETAPNIHSLTIKNESKMSMYNYGIGGNEVKLDASEAILEIQGNKTLIAQKLTAEDAINPEAVTGLKTVDDVFRYFKPQIGVSFETQNGETVKEDLKFRNLGDFTAKNITAQSNYLNSLSVEQEQYSKILKQLKANKVLRSMLENEETRQAFLEALKTLSQELS